MKKQIIFTSLGILLLVNLVSATTIIAGNNYTFSVNTTNPLVYDVVGNSSNMNGFSVYQDGYNITFVIDYRFKPDNFTIILFDNSTKEIIKEVHHYSGGGTRIIYKNHTIYEDKLIEIPKYVNETEPQEPCPLREIRNYTIEFILLGILAIILIVFLIALYFIKKHKIEKSINR